MWKTLLRMSDEGPGCFREEMGQMIGHLRTEYGADYADLKSIRVTPRLTPQQWDEHYGALCARRPPYLKVCFALSSALTLEAEKIGLGDEVMKREAYIEEAQEESASTLNSSRPLRNDYEASEADSNEDIGRLIEESAQPERDSPKSPEPFGEVKDEMEVDVEKTEEKGKNVTPAALLVPPPPQTPEDGSRRSARIGAKRVLEEQGSSEDECEGEVKKPKRRPRKKPRINAKDTTLNGKAQETWIDVHSPLSIYTLDDIAPKEEVLDVSAIYASNVLH